MTLFIASIFLSGCSQNQKYLDINNHKIKIEIADTDSKREQGLSGRNSLCTDCGMLFVFDKPGIYGFWMKDMKFPLDFIYIKGDKVVDIKQNISPSTYPEILNSSSDFDKVIEVNSGYIGKNQIQIGEVVKYTP